MPSTAQTLNKRFEDIIVFLYLHVPRTHVIFNTLVIVFFFELSLGYLYTIFIYNWLSRLTILFYKI